VEATLSYFIEAPNLVAREWIIFAAVPPQLPSQSDVQAAIQGGGTTITELSDLKRPVLFMQVPVNTKGYTNATGKSILVRVDYRATLIARKLVVGRPSLPVGTLPKRARDQGVAPTPTCDFQSEEIQVWLDKQSLRRGSEERDLDFAYRVFQRFRKELDYKPENEQRRASRVCQDQCSDCAGICNLYVAVLRANNVPARVLPGRLAKSGEGPSASCHVRSEFFAEGIGWVPVEITSAVSFKEFPDGNFFGVDDGSHLAFHADTDLVLDTKINGKKTIPHVQWVFYWVDGTGTLKDHTRKVTWQVRSTAVR
jgi:transglutaminase-like putative cysteine protease